MTTSRKKKRQPLRPLHLKGHGPYLIFGDVHGCLTELKELYEEVGKDFPNVTKISCGDLVDRGPHVGKTVDFCRETETILVLGNHEEKLLRAKKGNPVQLRAHHKVSFDELEQDEKRWQYLRSAPPFVRILDFNTIVVHGGFFPRKKPEAQNLKHIIRLRSYDPETGRLYAPEDVGGVNWIDEWRGPEYVFYGHIHREEVVTTPYTCGLDTGVVYGNKLTGVVLSHDEEGNQRAKFYQIPAKQTYWTEDTYIEQ